MPSLVPVDQPYGERQRTEGVMRSVGLPTEQSSVGVGPFQARSTQSASSPPAPTGPSFDALAMLTPTPPQEAPAPQLSVEDRLFPMLESPNPAVREVAARFLRRRRGAG